MKILKFHSGSCCCCNFYRKLFICLTFSQQHTREDHLQTNRVTFISFTLFCRRCWKKMKTRKEKRVQHYPIRLTATFVSFRYFACKRSLEWGVKYLKDQLLYLCVFPRQACSSKLSFKCIANYRLGNVYEERIMGRISNSWKLPAIWFTEVNDGLITVCSKSFQIFIQMDHNFLSSGRR